MDKPTVGRRVWYWPIETERSIPLADEDFVAQPFDAGIAHVNADGTINVSITNDMGYPIHPRQNVVLRDTPDQARGGECSWMTYHVKKAQEDAGTTVVRTGADPTTYAQSPGEPLPGG
jgi:hypothetical protein